MNILKLLIKLTKHLRVLIPSCFYKRLQFGLKVFLLWGGVHGVFIDVVIGSYDNFFKIIEWINISVIYVVYMVKMVNGLKMIQFLVFVVAIHS